MEAIKRKVAAKCAIRNTAREKTLLVKIHYYTTSVPPNDFRIPALKINFISRLKSPSGKLPAKCG